MEATNIMLILSIPLLILMCALVSYLIDKPNWVTLWSMNSLEIRKTGTFACTYEVQQHQKTEKFRIRHSGDYKNFDIAKEAQNFMAKRIKSKFDKEILLISSMDEHIASCLARWNQINDETEEEILSI